METDGIIRKIQFRQGSYAITIPMQAIRALGIRKNQYVRFTIRDDRMIISMVSSDITKQDMADAKSMTFDPSYMEQETEQVQDTSNDTESGGASRLDTLRM